ncbi:MAG TPA: phospholipase D-like domain-containing protein [Longimicrobiales bacterium]|nr:phospholipase D-like domain-containing protein [Longimicrobiales bacterium]
MRSSPSNLDTPVTGTRVRETSPVSRWRRRVRRRPHLGRKGRWILALALLFPAVVLLHRLGDAARGTPVRDLVVWDSLPDMASPDFRRMAAAGSEITMTPGNRVELLVDAEIFPRILEDVAAARRSVTVFIYFCASGDLGDRVADALSERARAGVAAYFLGDGFGCRDFLDDVGPRLRDAGVRVTALRPVRWYALHRAQHRNHARGVVVDGAVAYTGGFGIADVWAGTAGAIPWRDTNVRVTGPVVAALQGAFAAAWGEATGELLAGAAFVAEVAEPGHEAREPGGEGAGPDAGWAGLLVSRPGMGTTRAERFYTVTLHGAQRSLYLANSYFVPNRETRRLLVEAAGRGVDVRVLVPGTINDVPGTRWAGQRWFRELLEGGVRIFEYQGTMMHAKTAVADGAWATVGSVNLDNRSLRLNEEWSLVVHGPEVAGRLDSLFLADLGRARERTLEIHRSRPLQDRLREVMVSLLAPFF